MTPWYSDVALNGAYVKLFRDSHLEFNGQRVELPNGQNVLFVRIAPDGSKFAGVGHRDDLCWEWDGAWTTQGIAFGPQAVIYDRNGNLRVLGGPPAVGYRFDNGSRLVTCDETRRDLARSIWDYTDLGDLTIGQGGDALGYGDDPVIALWQGERKLLQEGRCRFINAYRDGDRVAYACVREDTQESLTRWMTLAEIDASQTIDAASPAPPAPPVQVGALPRKVWMAPFFSHSARYGDTSDHAGNAVWLPDSDLGRVSGQPLIVAAGQNVPAQWLDLTVAYWCSGATVDELGESVQRALTFATKPVIAYLDQDGWPDPRPAWVTSRVWPSIMGYRNAGESLGSFDVRISTILRRVSGYGQPLVLTPAFYTRNNTVPVSDILACMPLYDRWLREFQIVGFMPFADRRPTGMLEYPELRAWAHAFNRATERPRRSDYWTSEPEPGPRICPTCLRPWPLLPPGGDGPLAPERIDAVQRAIREHPEIDPMDEQARGRLVDYACSYLGGRPWGRKARNADGSNKNTDGLTYLRPDGRFEIIDVISGGDGSATWDHKGIFAPGANGWWAPYEPV